MRTLALLLLLALTGCAGTVTIKGIVRDAETGSPITDAWVEIGEQGASADHRGVYVLQVVPLREPRTLSATAQGYHSRTEFRTFSNSQGVTVVNLDLTMKGSRRGSRGDTSINVVTTPSQSQGPSEDDPGLGPLPPDRR